MLLSRTSTVANWEFNPRIETQQARERISFTMPAPKSHFHKAASAKHQPFPPGSQTLASNSRCLKMNSLAFPKSRPHFLISLFLSKFLSLILTTGTAFTNKGPQKWSRHLTKQEPSEDKNFYPGPFQDTVLSPSKSLSILHQMSQPSPNP